MVAGHQFVVIGFGTIIMVQHCFAKNWIQNLYQERSPGLIKDWDLMQLELENVEGMINGQNVLGVVMI